MAPSSNDGHNLPKPVKPGRVAFETDTFDIFSGISDRDALWMDAAVGINQARARMQQIADSEPGDYFIFHVKTGAILARARTEPKIDAKPKPRTGEQSH